MPLDNIAPVVAAPQSAPVSADTATQQAPQGAAPANNDIPAPFADVIAGTIPAVTVPGIEKSAKPDPAQAFVIASLDKLTQAGLDFYEAHDHNTVLFNPAKITEAQLAEADKAGKLNIVAPPATQAAAPAQEAAAAPEVDAAPAPDALATLPAPAAKPSPTLTRGRLANVGAVKANGIKPNPVPAALARRPV